MPRLLPYEQRIIQREITKTLSEEKVPTERRKIAITDQDAILHLDIREVLNDRVEFLDDREPRPR